MNINETVLNFPRLVMVLEQAVSPVILISGMGLLILAMTNQLGRVIDRSRKLKSETTVPGSEQYFKIARQLTILWKRARTIRAAIIFAAISVLIAAFIIILLFVFEIFGIAFDLPIVVVLFVLCLASIISSSCFFIFDINQSLRALEQELKS